MKFKDSGKYFVVFPLIFLVLHLFAAAVPLGSDVYCKPVWIRTFVPDTASEELAGTAAVDTYIPPDAARFNGKKPNIFMTDTHFGYFTAEGDILYASPLLDGVSASRHAWTHYASDAVETPVYRPDGTLITNITEAGFGYIEEDRLFLFEPGGSAVKRYTAQGEPLWRYLHTSPITAFQSSKAGAVIGFADGKLVCLDEAGKVRFEFYPGGSDYQVILGAALSDDGLYAVCVCGIRRQRVLLIRIDENKHKIVYHRYLNGDLRRQVFVQFNHEGTNAVFECAEGIGLIDCRRLVSGIIPEQGVVIASGFHPYNNITAVLDKQDQSAAITLIEGPVHSIGKTQFPAKTAFLSQDRDMVFLAADTRLARIDIKGMTK